MPNAPAHIPIVDAVSPLLGDTQAWICDIWGVVHNGVAAFPEAVDACNRFRAQGGVVLLLTNAPRPAGAVEDQLAKLNVPRTAFDAVLTSGDLTLSLILQHRTKPMLHLGPDRDKGLFAGQGVRLTGIADAEVIVCSGLYDDETETAEDYRERLTSPAHRGVPMICANPDVTVARGDKIIECAGALAALYDTLGGPVIYAGKPHLPIYDMACQMIHAAKGNAVSKHNILAIGDGVNTDIKGAANAGLRSIFVASPVHVHEALTPASVSRLFANTATPPAAAMSRLAW